MLSTDDLRLNSVNCYGVYTRFRGFLSLQLPTNVAKTSVMESEGETVVLLYVASLGFADGFGSVVDRKVGSKLVVKKTTLLLYCIRHCFSTNDIYIPISAITLTAAKLC